MKITIILKDFSDSLINSDRAERTIAEYTANIKQFAAWFESRSSNEFSPELVTSLDIRDYRQSLIDNRLSPNTINARLAAIRAFCRWAQDSGEIAHNPAANIKAIAQERPSPKWLTRPEQNALLREAEKQVQLGALRAQIEGDLDDHPGAIWPVRNHAIITLALSTGLRLSEIAALQTNDIQITDRAGSVTVRDGKGHKAREIPLNKDARIALNNWIGARPEQIDPVTRTTSDALFLSQKGGSMCPRAIAECITEIARKAELDISPHALRHTFGKNMIDAGHDLRTVACLMGHSSLETTRIYTVPSQADLQAAVEKIAWSD